MLCHFSIDINELNSVFFQLPTIQLGNLRDKNKKWA